MPKERSVIERFLDKVCIKENGCWHFTGEIRNGYGRFYVAQRPVQAHVFAYEYWVDEVCLGEELDHDCHTKDDTCYGGTSCPHRKCVNPDHMILTDHETNIRLANGWTQQNGIWFCRRGHEMTEYNTQASRTNIRCRACNVLTTAKSRRRKG